MKTIIATALLVALAIAEPPPSNSYLPPSPGGQGQFGSAPQVIAARSFDGAGARHGSYDHGAQGHGKPFARNSLDQVHGHHQAKDHQGHQAQARFGQGYPEAKNQGYPDARSQGYEYNAAALARQLEEASAEPANYHFGYMVNDLVEGADFGHHEERQEDAAHGEYHVVLPDGRKQTVSYEADDRGFKPHISYEDTDAQTRSGYDDNANNFRSGNGYSNGAGNHGNEYNGAGHGIGRNGGY